MEIGKGYFSFDGAISADSRRYLFVAHRICPTRRSGAPPIPWNAGRRGGPR